MQVSPDMPPVSLRNIDHGRLFTIEYPSLFKTDVMSGYICVILTNTTALIQAIRQLGIYRCGVTFCQVVAILAH